MIGDTVWPEVKMGDVCEEITVGYVGPMTAEYRESGVPFLRSMNIEPFRINKTDLKYVSPEFHAKIRKSRLRAGDVVIVRTGDPGTAAVVPEWMHDGNCSDLVIARPGPGVDARFLCYYVNAVSHHIVNEHVVGAVQQHFNVGSAKDLKLPLPPLPEQRAIARVLGGLDDKIELNRRMNQTLEELARGLFRSWFVDFDPVTRNANAMAPATHDGLFPKCLVNAPSSSSLGYIPHGWGMGCLGNWCEVNSRTVQNRPRDGEFHYIDISSVSRGHLDGPRPLQWKDAPSRAQRLVAHGDTLWSCVRPNLEAYLLLHRPAPEWVASTGFAVLSPRTSARSFVHLATTQPDFVDYLTARAEGSAYPAVRPDAFTDAPLIHPPETVVKKFESIVGPWMDRCGENRQESKRLATLRNALLPQLLSGEIRLGSAERAVEEVMA